MTKDDVRAAANRLLDFHERFAPTFGKAQAQDNAFTYIKGLMICPERKSIEPIALNVGNGNVSAMQKFILLRQGRREPAWPLNAPRRNAPGTD
jgi:hypothetical protein